MGRLLHSIRYWLSKRQMQRATRAFNEPEARAVRRGDTQAIGRSRKAKTDAIHAALRNDRSQSV
jgi:hypothetical protein